MLKLILALVLMLWLMLPLILKLTVMLDLILTVMLVLTLLSWFLQPGFMPDMPMPSPDALSPSALKSASQFYSSYSSNGRRRPPEAPMGKAHCGLWS